MPKKAFEKLSDDTKTAMIEKSMQLYLDNPYEQVTLKMILDALEIHPATFYRYFDDKDELYIFLIARIVDKMGPYLDENYEPGKILGNPQKNERALKLLTEQELDFSQTVMAIPNDILLRVTLEVEKGTAFNYCKTAMRRLRYEGKLREDVDEDLSAYIFSTVTFNLILFCRE